MQSTESGYDPMDAALVDADKGYRRAGDRQELREQGQGELGKQWTELTSSDISRAASKGRAVVVKRCACIRGAVAEQQAWDKQVKRS